MKRRPVIIAYDIVSNKRRRQVFRCLQAWRLDGQYSLFECRLSQPEADELFIQLTDLIECKEDCLLLAWLDGSRESRAVTASNIGFKSPAWYEG